MGVTRDWARKDIAPLALRIGLLALGYFVGARLGLQLAYENRNVTPFWPPTGIAVAAFVAWGPRVWPGVALGAVAANIANGAGLETSVGIAFGNTLAPLLGTLALTRFGFQRTLERGRDILLLFSVGAFGAMLISSGWGTAILWMTGQLGTAPTVTVWLVWWLGDSIGVVLFAPVLMLMHRLTRPNPLAERPIEAIGLFATAVAASLLVFHFQSFLPYVVFIPLVWAALRFESLGVALVVVVAAVIAVTETVGGRGPFTALDPTDNLVALQTFNAAIAFTTLLLASVMHERMRAEGALRASEERYRSLFEHANDFVCVHDRIGDLTYVNAAAERITGYSRDRLQTMNISELVAPEHLRVVRRTTAQQLAGTLEATTYEVDIVGTSGRRVALEASTAAVRDNGEPVGIQLIGRDITSRRLAEEQLRRQTLRDPLTGLPNETLLVERLGYAFALARRERAQVALALLDVDRFKEINDEYGHRAGDDILVALGERLTTVFREPDTVARLTGDEFAVLIPALPRDKLASVIGEQIRAELTEAFDCGEASIMTTASIGIAVFPHHGDDPRTLMQRADFAMFAAKRAGGDRYSVYSPEQDSHGARRLVLLDELHSAIPDGSLILHFQPKIEFGSMRTIGVECLLRWMHPRIGLVPPVEFVPLAESSGLIHEITAWVLNETLQRCAIWDEAGHRLSVAVNVSTASLLDGRIVDTLMSALDRSDVAPERLVLEIPERAVVEESVHAVVMRLGSMGVRISVDDFGTASSSIANLKRLSIGEVKIDRSFVGGMASNADDRDIARSIIELGHNLGVPVVAEGVESRETWNKLAALGCDQAQGFLICPPVPAAELESWLLTPAWSGRVR